MSSRTADRIARTFALAALLVAGAIAGCNRAAPVAESAPPARPKHWNDIAAKELLRPDSGAVIADRSGEYTWQTCALNVLDGASATYWLSPPEDPEQWLILDLPTRSRVTQVGATTTEPGGGVPPPAKLRFEGSLDGKTFTELRTVDLGQSGDRRMFDVPPTELRSLRVTMVATPNGPRTACLPSLHLSGEELDPVAMPRFAGRWSIDGRPFEIAQQGDVVYGVAPMKPPMIFYGAIDGRVARLAWIRGNETGIAWLAVNPSSTRLSGFWWWLDPLMNPTLGEPWYGERVGDAPEFKIEIPAMAQVYLRKLGQFPLYSLLFRPDGNFDLEASRSGVEFIQRAVQAFPNYRVRLEVVESNSWDPAKNLAIAAERGKRLQAALVAEGIPASRLLIEPRSRTDLNSPLYRLMYNHVDFSLSGN